MSWTDERVDQLRRLWAEGLSASQIAGVLGNVTRNAVIGKVHRLGLAGRTKVPGQSNVTRPRRTVRENHTAQRVLHTGQRNPVNLPARTNGVANERAATDLVAPKPLMLALTQLSESTCKWPIGDPATDEFHFCGNGAQHSGPYCAYHARLAYQPAAERRRDRKVANAE
jgi:GcrA cell cycle regulator